MSQHKCELCGTPVKVVGKTTKYYEPIRQPVSVPSKERIASIIDPIAGCNSFTALSKAEDIIALLTEGKVKQPI